MDTQQRPRARLIALLDQGREAGEPAVARLKGTDRNQVKIEHRRTGLHHVFRGTKQPLVIRAQCGECCAHDRCVNDLLHCALRLTVQAPQ